jgi:hypothetical protein
MKYHIYTIEHPMTNEIRYVGYTKTTLKERLKSHLKNVTECESKSRRWNKRLTWIKSIISASKIPIIKKLDVCNTIEEAKCLEKYWISQFKTWGFRLTNMTSGGDGGDTFSMQSPSEKIRISKTISDKLSGRKRDESSNEKFRQTVKERGHWSKKPGAVFSGTNRIPSEETRRKMSEAKLGTKQSKETVAKRKALSPPNKGISKYSCIIQCDMNNMILNKFDTPGKAVEFLNLPTHRQSEIVRCCKGKTKKALGFIWKFETIV